MADGRNAEFARVRAVTFEPYTQFRVTEMGGAHVNVTAAGYRVGAAPQTWPPARDAVNVFVFGGSMAFGYGVSDGETVPAQLESLLRAAHPGKRITVYNFAVPNYDGSQMRIRLEQLLLAGHKPDIAVFLDGFSVFIAPFYAPVMHRLFADALAHQGFAARLAHALKRTPDVSAQCIVPDATEALARYAANRKLIEAVCDAFGVEPLFVWQPVPCYRYARTDAEPIDAAHGPDAAQLLACVRQGYDLMEARKDGGDARFLWLADMQRERRDQLYCDPDHYNPAFSREIAEQIAQALAPAVAGLAR